MGIFIGWIIFSIVIGAVGSDRKIGFFVAFLLSLFLSPIIGLIFTLTSKSLAEEAYKAKILKNQKNQQETLKKLAEVDLNNTNSIIDELEKLRKLKEDGLITEEEFQNLKNKIINS